MINRRLFSGSLWTPTRLGSAVVTWFDAGTLSTLTLSGSAVTSWASRAGSITASQGTSSKRPTYSATARNSLPGVSFDGSDDVLQFSSTTGLPSGDSDGFLCAVGYSNASGFRYMVSYGDTGTTTNGSRSAAVNSSGNAAFVVFGTSNDVNSNVSWNGSDRVFVAQGGSGQLSLTIDGQLSPQTVSTTLVTTSPGAAMLGAYSGGNSYWSGVLQEALIGNRKLTTGERQKMEGYLAWRWGLVSQLPSGHPYKTIRPR